MLYNEMDTLFLWSGQDFNYRSTGVLDLEFWNNNPAKFIYCGFIAVLDPETIIERFDEQHTSYNELGTAENLEISKQNDSLVFAGANRNVLISYDGARNWDTIKTLIGKELISLSPFNDSILFLQDDNKLLKSIDGGVSYSIVDTTFTDYESFKYDNDKYHIYRLTFSYPYNYLSVSNNEGNAFSWIKRFDNTSEIIISVDYSQSGVIYLADRKNIYVSKNYGESFDLYKMVG